MQIFEISFVIEHFGTTHEGHNFRPSHSLLARESLLITVPFDSEPTLYLLEDNKMFRAHEYFLMYRKNPKVTTFVTFRSSNLSRSLLTKSDHFPPPRPLFLDFLLPP